MWSTEVADISSLHQKVSFLHFYVVMPIMFQFKKIDYICECEYIGSAIKYSQDINVYLFCTNCLFLVLFVLFLCHWPVKLDVLSRRVSLFYTNWLFPSHPGMKGSVFSLPVNYTIFRWHHTAKQGIWIRSRNGARDDMSNTCLTLDSGFFLQVSSFCSSTPPNSCEDLWLDLGNQTSRDVILFGYKLSMLAWFS